MSLFTIDLMINFFYKTVKYNLTNCTKKLYNMVKSNLTKIERMNYVRMAKNSLKSTRKKVKVLGTETYVNERTGEVQEMQVISVEERDANFHKLWLGHIVEALDMLGSKKLKIVTYIMQNLNEENMFIMTYRKLERKLGVSRPTIAETFKTLQEANFLKRVQNGVYQVNPDVIFKGGKSKRLSVLIQYKKLEDESKEPSKAVKKAKEKGFEIIEGGEVE